jgi:hypothetical protein
MANSDSKAATADPSLEVGETFRGTPRKAKEVLRFPAPKLYDSETN